MKCYSEFLAYCQVFKQVYVCVHMCAHTHMWVGGGVNLCKRESVDAFGEGGSENVCERLLVLLKDSHCHFVV